MIASMLDVRRRSDLEDYTGELEGRISLRISDRYNGDSLLRAGHVTDTPLSFPVPCVVTADTTEGSTCSVTTSADAIAAGTVLEGKRAIWETGQGTLYDGGADGDGDTTGDNTLFAVQGLFVP